MVTSEEIRRKLEEKRRKDHGLEEAPPTFDDDTTNAVEEEEKIMVCPDCNIEYDGNAKFCTECGTALEEYVEPEPEPEPEVTPSFKTSAPATYDNIIIVSSNYVPGYNVVATKGFVYGLTVRSRGLGGQMAAGLRSAFGGEIKEYVKMMDHTRQEALQRMVDHAKEMGANAIISTRFDSDEISNVMQEILAYGTAVIIEEK
ncbi:MAG: hypothetical protein Kow0019_12030 [Methanobacteriaceae archaeon]